MNPQQGIYYQEGARPGASFRIAFLRARSGRNAAEVGQELARIWHLVRRLQRGEVPDLEGASVPHSNLTALLGVGISAFEIDGVTTAPPQALGRFGLFVSPDPAGGGPLLYGAGLNYDASVSKNDATEHFAIQFIADTELATNRAVVEIWKLLHDRGSDSALVLGRVFDGFQRDDGRSWIDFHDGISNLKSGEERRSVLEIKPENVPNEEDAWTAGGTYLAFIRLDVSLDVWRRLSRTKQELLVGRDKITGCPLDAVSESGEPVLATGCPFTGTTEITQPGNGAFLEPVDTSDAVIRDSHVQRANRHVGVPGHTNSLRIFRQGYEFFERVDRAPGFRVGLNFVSFQDTPHRLLRILTQPQWLGEVNFGGAVGEGPPLLSVLAAGIYLAPPAVSDDAPFPGSQLFLES